MEKKKREIQVNMFVDLIKHYLFARGIKYSNTQNTYYFQVGDQNCAFTILGRKIKIENYTTKKVDIYDLKPTNSAIFTHARFRGTDFEELCLTQSEVYFEEGKMLMTSSGAKIETPIAEGKCSNKLLFLSDMLMGPTVFDTLENIQNLDGSKAIAFTHDVPRITSEKIALSSVIRNEHKIYTDISNTKTR